MYRRLTFSFSLFYNFSRPELVEFSCLEGQSDEIFDLQKHHSNPTGPLANFLKIIPICVTISLSFLKF